MKDEMVLRRISSKISHYFPSGISRGRTVFLLMLLCFSILIIPAFLMERSSKLEIDSLKKKFYELTVLSNEYNSLKSHIDVIEKRMSLTKVDGITGALNDIFSSVGIKEKIKSVKAVGAREIQDSLREERAEVEIGKVNMNELVNLLYKIENAPMMVSIKKVSIKKSFESPELLDVTMTIVLFTPSEKMLRSDKTSGLLWTEVKIHSKGRV